MAAPRGVLARDRLPLAVDHLVDDGALLTDLRIADAQDRVARFLVDRDLVDAVEDDLEARRIGAGRDDEVVLELPLGPVERQVHAGHDVASANPSVGRDLGVPRARVRAEHVVRLAGQRLLAGEDGLAARAGDVHPQRPRRVVAPSEREHDLTLRDEDRVALPSCDVLHAGVGLTGVLLEGHRERRLHLGGRAARRSRGDRRR